MWQYKVSRTRIPSLLPLFILVVYKKQRILETCIPNPHVPGKRRRKKKMTPSLRMMPPPIWGVIMQGMAMVGMPQVASWLLPLHGLPDMNVNRFSTLYLEWAPQDSLPRVLTFLSSLLHPQEQFISFLFLRYTCKGLEIWTEFLVWIFEFLIEFVHFRSIKSLLGVFRRWCWLLLVLSLNAWPYLMGQSGQGKQWLCVLIVFTLLFLFFYNSHNS